MHDLLCDPLIGVVLRKGTAHVSLPDLLAALVNDDMRSYTGLRPHQAGPWHALTVQLAASVMARQPTGTLPPKDSSTWREGLLGLADGNASAWQLVVEEVTKPGFMQHPLRAATELKAWKVAARTPDEIDVLVTSKDHDVKGARINPDDAESWLFALVTYQTTSGFLGAGNYGSVRMNGGFGSRAFVSFVEHRAPAARFREELDVLVSCRHEVLGGAFGYKDRGCVLTWLKPWSREESQWSITELDPLFVEAVRPVRLRVVGTKIEAVGTTSKSRQIGPKSVDNGDVGDPWQPINVGDKKKGRSALTVGSAGWSPETLCRVIFQQEIQLTPLQRPRPGMRTNAWLTGSVLVRGQGTTDGFRQFEINIPARARSWLEKPDDRETLAKLAQKLLGDAKEVEKSLRAAVMSLASGGPEDLDAGNKTLDVWARNIVGQETLGWSDRLFTSIWRATEESPDKVRADWCAELVSRARGVLGEAERKIPLSSSRRYRAAVRAHNLLEGSLRKKGLITSTNNTMTEEVAT